MKNNKILILLIINCLLGVFLAQSCRMSGMRGKY